MSTTEDRAVLLRRLLDIGYAAVVRGASPESARFIDQLLLSLLDDVGPTLASAIACATAEEWRRRRTCPTCGNVLLHDDEGED